MVFPFASYSAHIVCPDYSVLVGQDPPQISYCILIRERRLSTVPYCRANKTKLSSRTVSLLDESPGKPTDEVRTAPPEPQDEWCEVVHKNKRRKQQ